MQNWHRFLNSMVYPSKPCNLVNPCASQEFSHIMRLCILSKDMCSTRMHVFSCWMHAQHAFVSLSRGMHAIPWMHACRIMHPCTCHMFGCVHSCFSCTNACTHLERESIQSHEFMWSRFTCYIFVYLCRTCICVNQTSLLHAQACLLAKHSRTWNTNLLLHGGDGWTMLFKNPCPFCMDHASCTFLMNRHDLVALHGPDRTRNSLC